VQEIAALKRVVDDERSTDSDVAEAVAHLLTVKEEMQEALNNIDASLGVELSQRAKARSLVTGIIDNGLGILAGKIDPAIMRQHTPERVNEGRDQDRSDVH
jgi:hypothetical protein